MKSYVVYDSAAEAYGLPLFMKTNREAIRAFTQAAKDPQSQLSKSPADYTLFETGEYDELTGTLSQYQAMKNLGTALEYSQRS